MSFVMKYEEPSRTINCNVETISPSLYVQIQLIAIMVNSRGEKKCRKQAFLHIDIGHDYRTKSTNSYG